MIKHKITGNKVYSDSYSIVAIDSIEFTYCRNNTIGVFTFYPNMTNISQTDRRYLNITSAKILWK